MKILAIYQGRFNNDYAKRGEYSLEFICDTQIIIKRNETPMFPTIRKYKSLKDFNKNWYVIN